MKIMNAESLLNNIMNYYNLKNMSELATKLEISQSVISNWKSRNAIGAIVEKISSVDQEALSYIFGDGDSSISIIQASGGRAAAGNYNESTPKIELPQFEELTILLIKSLIEKMGEVELQSKLMELKRNG